MLISDDEWAMLQGLAEKTGITASDWVRLRIREAHNVEQPQQKKPKRK